MVPPSWEDLDVDAPRDEWHRQKPQFGEKICEWSDILNLQYWRPNDDGYGEPGGYDLSDMQRLRGLIMVQAAETEAVLGRVLLRLDPHSKPEKMMAGALLKRVWDKLPDSDKITWQSHVRQIRQAQKRRNRAVHDRPNVGYSWRDYATGGGEWVPVITLLGNDLCDEEDLRDDLALQQSSTVYAIELLHALACSNHDPSEDCPDWWE